MKTTVAELRAIVEAVSRVEAPRPLPVYQESRLARSVRWVSAFVVAAMALYFTFGLLGVLFG